MHITGTMLEPQFTFEGKMRLIVEVDERQKAIDEVEPLLGKRVNVDAKKYSPKKSPQANSYFWALTTEIGQAIGVDKWTAYLMELSKWGVCEDVQIKGEDAMNRLMSQFRFATELDRWIEGEDDWHLVRCYFGISGYTKDEMNHLITNTIDDAKSLGIDTAAEDEIRQMISAFETEMKGRKYDTSM